MRIRNGVIGFALVAAAMVPARSHAQGWIEGAGVVRERTSVSVRVKDQVATVEVEEWFRNRGGNLAEGDYLYPLPAGAVFTNYSLFQGDQELRGEMMDATEARRIYEEIVRRKKDPALIELVGHGLVRARVFPIGAGETRRVVLRYTQTLQRAGDALEFRYAANRSGGTAPVTFALTAENASAFRDAVSPTHEITVRRERGSMVVRPSNSVREDFALLLPFAERSVGIVLSTHRPTASEDGFFMLRLSPGDVADAVRVPRDVTVVLDVSGSMSGEKIEQAKAALHQLLGTLGNGDRFRLIKFSSTASAWREEWTQATSAEVRVANRWVDQLRAEGGTNISEALSDAFRAVSPAERLSVVVFLTDGLPSVGEQNPDRIAALAERSAGRTRVFAFGVGHDVNTYLLDLLGAAARGSAQYVQPGESVETALGLLATRIRFPVLTNLASSATGVTLRDVYPKTMPDLFAGEDLVVFGRYRGGSRSATVTITGERGGRTERYSTRASFATQEDGNDYIPRLWASRKLGELTRRARLEGNDRELIAEIRETALRYGLLSEYTSYFVTEPGMPVMAQADFGGVRRDAAANKAASGAGAVATAEASRLRRETATVGQLAAVEKAEEMRYAAAAPPPSVVSGRAADAAQRVVAGRTFVQRAGVWEDAGMKKGAGALKTIDIVAYSDAYFSVLRALPELKPYTVLGSVAIAGDVVSIRFMDKGVSRMSAAELAQITTQFRSKTNKP